MIVYTVGMTLRDWYNRTITVTWVQEAPRPGFWWVGYQRDGVEYAGHHVDAEGRDQRGQQVYHLPPEQPVPQPQLRLVRPD